MQCYDTVPSPRVFITSWALDSYLELVPRVVSLEDYWSTLRPDILRLIHRSTDPKFNHPSFWGPAQSGPTKVIPQAFKMKWHNIGPGKIQLRLGVVEHEGDYFLCHAWSKTSQHLDFARGGQLLSRRALLIKDPLAFTKGALRGPRA